MLNTAILATLFEMEKKKKKYFFQFYEIFMIMRFYEIFHASQKRDIYIRIV